MEMESMGMTHPSMVDQYIAVCWLIHFVHGIGEEGKMHIPSSKAASER
jgi:hypothetical protein